MKLLRIHSLIFLFVISLSHLNSQQPTEEWVRRFSDTSSTVYGASVIKFDSLGNIYINARSSNKFGFVKYNQSGDIISEGSYWPGVYESGSGSYLDLSMPGNVYCAGNVSIGSNSWIYIVKFNTNGIFQWGKSYQRDNENEIIDLKVDKDGNIVILGTAQIGSDVFGLIIKYNQNGDTLWTKYFNNGQSHSLFTKMFIDNTNNIYITGTLGLPASCLIMKCNSNGTINWFTTYINIATRTNLGRGISVDANGNVYVLGTVNVPFAGLNNFLVKFNNNGTILWSKTFTGIISGQGRNNGIPFGPAITKDGNSVYYTTMSSNGTGGGGYSMSTIKYNSLGDSQWVKTFSGGVPATANFPAGILLDKFGNIYVCGVGYFQTTGDDFVTIKYNSTSTPQWITTYTGLVSNGGDYVKGFIIDTNTNVYLVGGSPGVTNSGVAVTIKYNQPIGINPNSNELPVQFNLYQNYPNPFNSATIINYEIPKSSFVELKVYNSLGQLVKTLVNSEQSASYYTINLNTEDLSSGVYFYTLKAENVTIDTRKMVLVK